MAYSSVRGDPVSTTTARDTMKPSKHQEVTQHEITRVDSLYQGQYHTARRPLARGNILGTIVDVFIPAAALYFLVLAWLVYVFRDQPIDQEPAPSLIKASQLGPTIFPVVFAAIAGRFLNRLAAYKLEEGARVMTLEYLLYARSVFNALTAPFALGTFNILAVLLIVLWALSPLGGQASLRVITPGVLSSTVSQNFTYVAYVSPFTTGGAKSTTSNFLGPINAAFMGALFSSATNRASHQDLHGNIKIPIYEELASSNPADNSTWRPVISGEETTWSSLTGVPVHGLEKSMTSRFNLNTAYMTTQCEVSGREIPFGGPPFTRTNFTTLAPFANSGANIAVSAPFANPFNLYEFTFYSLADAIPSPPEPPVLTNATCNVTMRYVEVQVECHGMDCRALAVRPSSNPAIHIEAPLAPLASLDIASVLSGGLSQDISNHQTFFSSFVTATNPSLACDTSTCKNGGIEGFIADPDNPFTLTGIPRLVDVGDRLFSQRLSQLMNTYWLDGIAPYAITGNFSLKPNDDEFNTYTTYKTDWTIGTAETRVEVIKCNYVWLAILVISSVALFLCGLVSAVFSIRRRAPDTLDRFSTNLRENPYVHDPQAFSMEDSFAKAIRLRNVMVRLGDVQPHEDVGYVALAPAERNAPIQRGGRTYF